MKITEIFNNKFKTFSFEFFPPKDEISAIDFGINVGRLMKLSPSFVTVTYGAGGSTQERTFTLVNYLQNKVGLTTVAHYTCVNAEKEKIKKDLDFLESIGIENLMLLRGDPPKGEKTFKSYAKGFNYASDLIAFVRENYNFCIAGAAYVEKHPESGHIDEDTKYLKEKVRSGADFLVTQLFFCNEYYFRLLRKLKDENINCRIIPGIIPITAYKQIERFTSMTAAKIPDDLKEKMEFYKNDAEKMYHIGIKYTINQCRELLIHGAPGIHFYTLNKSRAAVEIFESLILR